MTVHLARFYRDDVILAAVYIILYCIYRIFLGLDFDTRIMGDMHFLAVDWLVSDLWRSLYYLHSQPPMMNFLTGIGLIFFSQSFQFFAEFLYFSAGLGALLFMHHTLILLNISRGISLSILISVCIFPSYFIFISWYYTPALELLLFSALMYFTALWCAGKMNWRIAMSIFVVASMLSLTHARWHLIVWIPFILMLGFGQSKKARKYIAISALCLFLPLCLWYGKNLALFGTFSSSSWLGTNLIQVFERMFSKEEWTQMQQRGVIYANAPIIYDQNKIIAFAPEHLYAPVAHISLSPYKVVETHWLNFNYIGIIDVSRQDMRDAMTLMRANFIRYLSFCFYQLWYINWVPAISYGHTPGLNMILKHANIAAPDWEPYWSSPAEVQIPLSYISFIFYSLLPCIAMAIILCSKKFSDRRRFALCAFYFIWSMLAIACFLNGWEHVRMRWSLLPAYIFFTAFIFDEIQKTIIRNKSAK